MPVWACFSYSADLPPNVTSRRAAQRAPRGPGSMPGYPCFVYPSDIPQAVSSPRKMPLPCFSYPLMCFSYPGRRGAGHTGAATARSQPRPSCAACRIPASVTDQENHSRGRLICHRCVSATRPESGIAARVPPVRDSKICFSYSTSQDIDRGVVRPVQTASCCFSHRLPLGIGNATLRLSTQLHGDTSASATDVSGRTGRCPTRQRTTGPGRTGSSLPRRRSSRCGASSRPWELPGWPISPGWT